MSRLSYYLENHGQLIVLPPGRILVGRGIECGVRFNDPTISRRHLVLEVAGDALSVEDTSSTNGTWVNSQRLKGRRLLKHGDVLQMGRRVTRVELKVDQDSHELITPTDLPGIQNVAIARAGEPRAVRASPASTVCPRCRAPRAEPGDTCASCGYPAKSRALAVTQILGEPARERRAETRQPVLLPLIYESSYMELEGRALDLSRIGVFVESELLDPVGTSCVVLLLPDGQPAVRFEGRVCRVAAKPEREGVAGMGISFTEVSEAAARWLACTLPSGTPRRHAAPAGLSGGGELSESDKATS